MAAEKKIATKTAVDEMVQAMVLTQAQIQEFEIPLDELTILEINQESFGPIWLSDLKDAKGTFEAHGLSYRYRKFGTEEWVEHEDTGHPPSNQIQTKPESEIKNTSLPEPPLQGLFSASEDEVKRFFLNEDSPVNNNIKVMAELMAIKPVRREIQPEPPAQDNVEAMPSENIPLKTSSKFFANKKYASIAAALAVVAVGTIWGINLVMEPTELTVAETSTSVNQDSQSDSNNKTTTQPVRKPASKKTSPMRARDVKRQADSSHHDRAQMRERKLERSRNARSQLNARQAEPDYSADDYGNNHDDGGIPVNDEVGHNPQFRNKNNAEDDDYQYDDGSGIVEQDPLRKKLSPRTLDNHDEFDGRDIASDEVPEVYVDEYSGDATVDMSNQPEEF